MHQKKKSKKFLTYLLPEREIIFIVLHYVYAMFRIIITELKNRELRNFSNEIAENPSISLTFQIQVEIETKIPTWQNISIYISLWFITMHFYKRIANTQNIRANKRHNLQTQQFQEPCCSKIDDTSSSIHIIIIIIIHSKI